MKNEEKIQSFAEETNEIDLKDYVDRLFENLKDMNEKEDKFLIWFVLILLVYLLSKSSQMESVNIGIITLNDLSIISKLLPLVMAYILFNLISLTNHKQEVMMALNILTEKKFSQQPLKKGDKSFNRSILIRLFFPYSFSNSISSIVTLKTSNIQALLGILLLIPSLLIVFVPYVIYIFMIIDVYKNYTDDTLGWISFLGSTWVFFVILFFITVKVKNDK